MFQNIEKIYNTWNVIRLVFLFWFYVLKLFHLQNEGELVYL